MKKTNTTTLLSRWNLIAASSSDRNLHRLSVAYRDYGDMIIWADGKLGVLDRTPRIEYEWIDLFDLDRLSLLDNLNKGNI